MDTNINIRNWIFVAGVRLAVDSIDGFEESGSGSLVYLRGNAVFVAATPAVIEGLIQSTNPLR